MQVQAYVLIQTEVGKAAMVATEIRSIAGVTLAEDVTGPYDVIDRKSTRLNSSHVSESRMPSSA